MSRTFLISFVILFSFLSCSSTSRFTSERKRSLHKSKKVIKSQLQKIRVLLDENSADNAFSFKSKVILNNEDDEIATVEANQKFHLIVENGDLFLQLKRRNYKVGQLSILPADDNPIEYKGRSYNGYMKIINEKNKFKVVNVIDLEDYINSVVLSEFGTKFSEKEVEAIKAFSVCVRNYTLLKLNEKKEDFDVYCSVKDQLYNGILHSSKAVEDAIKDAKGEVLKYDGQIAAVFYHSSCGGYTEDCSNVFKTQTRPYMAGIKDGDSPYCKVSPNFDWNENFTGDEIMNLLISAGYLDKDFTYVTSFEISDRFNSGRVKEISITAVKQNGDEKKFSISGNSIRNLLKSKMTKGILRSNFFEMNTDFTNGHLEKLAISGKGNGHGVGLCQWGAISQSREGKSYKEILSFYFPGTYLEEME